MVNTNFVYLCIDFSYEPLSGGFGQAIEKILPTGDLSLTEHIDGNYL
jgi:hypothetical protein